MGGKSRKGGTMSKQLIKRIMNQQTNPKAKPQKGAGERDERDKSKDDGKDGGFGF